MSDEKNKNNEELQELDMKELEQVTGGKGFVVEKETVIGGDNKIK